MMRFLAACASYGVIDALSVLSIFEAAVNAAGKCAEQNQGRAHTLWQPYSDSLVRITLLALPFLAAHTWTGDLVARFDALVASAASYGALRAAQVDLRFCPTAHKLDGSPCEQDSGSYALTGETLAAVREIHEGRLWGEIQVRFSLPRACSALAFHFSRLRAPSRGGFLLPCRLAGRPETLCPPAMRHRRRSREIRSSDDASRPPC